MMENSEIILRSLSHSYACIFYESYHLSLCMLSKNFIRQPFDIFFLENRI